MPTISCAQLSYRRATARKKSSAPKPRSSCTHSSLAVSYTHLDVYKRQAHDNGAGAATIMELARHFAQNPPRRTLRFIWFGAEEMGLMGSWAHVEKQKERTNNYIFMVNVDVAGGIIGNNSASVMGSDKLVSYLDAVSYTHLDVYKRQTLLPWSLDFY